MTIIRALTYDSLIAWEKTEEGISIRFCLQSGDEEVVRFQVSSVQAKEILTLLDEYFALLPEEYKHVDTMPNNEHPPDIPDPKLFLAPKKRIFFGKFGSRLEYLKGYYMESCAVSQIVPIRKFCFQIDTVIDNGAAMERVVRN